MLFNGTGLSLPEQLEAVKRAGYDAYEFWGWESKDLDELAALQRRLGLALSAFCTTGVPLVDPRRREEMLDGLAASIGAAQKLGCRTLIGLAGQTLPDLDRATQLESVVDGLKAAAPLLEKAGVTLVLEPLNTLVNHKGHFLSRSDEAFAIVREVASTHVKVLFDLYHQQVTEGNLILNATNALEWVGHFHLADHPGRHEPGTGEIHYGNVLAAIREKGYNGYCGLEYAPTGGAEDSLRQFLAQYNTP
ncbi:TIM barrel protein [Paenibacillus sp. IB182496]|uniref:TIM barrel protein n=2 Tax=Paenibacillus sabuli TaxID=2772509 RepID=A0A927BXK0_9BACL|nr:TIM barrel protein [Paenibacillus sabuli]